MALHQTAIFTLHHPTQRMRALIDRALAAYTRAYTASLHAFRHLTPQDILALAGRDGASSHRSPHTHQRLGSILFQSAPAAVRAEMAHLEYGVRESLREHVARTLLSYAAQASELTAAETSDLPRPIDPVHMSRPSHEKAERRFPTRLRPGEGERFRLQGLQRLSDLADNREEELRCAHLLQHSAEPRLVPIPFCRIDAKRHCGLFYNPDTKRYYARLYIVPFKSPRGRKITYAGRYVDLRSGEVYMREEDARHWAGIQSLGRSRDSVLVPLETGRWHHTPHRFLPTPFLPRPHGSYQPGGQAAIPVCAWLVKRGERYDLHVTFRLPDPPRLPTRTLLGLDRGLTCLAAGALVSADGQQIHETVLIGGDVLGERVRAVESATSAQQRRGRVVRGHARAHQATAFVNAAANQLVELARTHQSQVIMEDLRFLAAPRRRRLIPEEMRYIGGFSGRRRRTNFHAMLARRQYQNLLHAINARLALVGLPPVRLVAPAYTSLTCSVCGHVSADNRSRRDRERFRCVACGYEAHADVQAGINVARKSLWMAQRKTEADRGVRLEDRTIWQAFIQAYLGERLV